MFLILGALRLSRTVLDRYPDMLAAHLVARLLPERNTYEWIRTLLRQGCDVSDVNVMTDMYSNYWSIPTINFLSYSTR